MNENSAGRSEGKNLDELVRLSLLYDFYGTLLKEHKRRIFEDYVLNDYSLGEIAKSENMTRQGVFDMVKRCSRELKEYEEKLHLIEKAERIKKKAEKIQEIADKGHELTEYKLEMSENVQGTLKRIEVLAGEILEEI